MGREQYHNHTVDTIHIKKLDGNVNNADTVIVYGNIKGNINNCDNVIIINGNVEGNINNCDNVCGLLADHKPDKYSWTKNICNDKFN